PDRVRCITPPPLAEIGDFAGAALALDDDEVVAGERHPIQPQYLDRGRRPRFAMALAAPIDQGADPAPFAAGHENVADLHRAALDQHRRDRTAAPFELGFEDDAFGRTVRIGLQVEQFGLQQDRFLELVEIGLLERRHFDVEHLAAEFFDDELVLQQLLAHPFGLGVGTIDLVDRHDDRHLGRLGMADRLDRLFHDAVIGGHHQNDDVGDIGAAFRHAVRQLLDRDRLGDRDVAHDLDLLFLVHPLAFALAGAAHRGKAAHALAGILVQGAGDRQLAGAAALLVPRYRGDGAP